jgi:outer membrane protein assembly factor BamB/predicted negative regulator of RcsB-dependent stress response
MHRTHRFTSIATFTVVFALIISPPGAAQVDNPVYVDDSPQAWELFRQAQDQTAQNAGEAVRLYQELLDDFPLKLIPASEAATNQFQAVRQRVLEALRRNQELLERYRTIQKPLGEQLLAADELEQLAASRSLTEPGLEALLRLAQRDLEAGRFNIAMSYLRQAASHPDCVGRRAVHAQFMMGTAAHYLGQTDVAEAALERLSQVAPQTTESEDCRVQLAKLIAASSDELPNPANAQHVSQIGGHSLSTFGPLIEGSGRRVDVAAADDLTDVVAQTIWSRPLEDSLARRRAAITQEDEAFTAGGESTRRIDRTADLTTAVPTVNGETVYINEGHTVRAINRLTGREVWTYSNLSTSALSDRDAMASLDVNVVAVSPGPGGSVVTLTGYAQPGGRSESGRLICLDAETGVLRRSVNFSGLVDASSTEQLFAHGAPIIADGMIFIAARRMSMQSMTNAYVVALDLHTLDVKWVRYITSSGGLQARIRPFCTLVYENGALYIASAVGAAAKLEPSTGEILWLHRFSTPITITLADQVRRPWELGGPVVTSRGVLAIEPDQRHVVLLDGESGSQLASLEAGTASGWNQPRYLLANEDMVFAIGSEIRAFALDDLENTAWRLPEAASSDAAAPRGPGRSATGSDSIDIRGRVQLISDALIVPTTEGVLVVDASSGQITNSIPIQPPGNPLAIESQLLIAASDRLDAYMSFGKAERMLRDRIAQAPAEPEPALSLVRLAMRVRQLPLALEAADLAMRAIDRAGVAAPPQAGARAPADSRAELLSLLLEIADSRLAESAAEGELLFGAIDAAATEPQQRVEYLLAYGQWLSADSLNRAVEAYQTILTNRNLAEAWRVRDAVMRSSSSWARERLSELIAQRGMTAYAPQADFAAMRLKQIVGANPAAADPAQLLALADEFPFSEAAVQAALQAATNHLERGNHRAAAAGLLNLYRANPQSEPARRLLGKLVSVCTAAGWNAQMNAIVRLAASAHGDISLITDSGPLNPTTWLASRASSSNRLPIIGEGKPKDEQQSQAHVITGALIEPYRQIAGPSDPTFMAPADRSLFRLGDLVRLYGTNLNQPLWTSTIPADIPQVLRFNENDVLLWLKSDPQDPKAVMLNASDGKVRWTTPRLNELLADPVRDLGRSRPIEKQMPDGEPFDPAQTLPLVSDHSVILVQRTGGVVAFDARDGNSVRWQKKQTLEQVHFAALHECALVLAGMAREIGVGGGNATLAPRIMALDPVTGEIIHDQTSAFANLGPSPISGVKWMRIAPMGQLVFGTASGLHMVDLFSGKRMWSSSGYAALDSQRAWHFDSAAGGLIIEDQRSRLRSVNLRDGTISEAFEVPLRGEWDPLDLRSLQLIGGRVIALYPQRVVVYDSATGALVGSDVISDDRDYRFLLPADGKLVLVNSRVMQAPVPDQPGRRAQQWEYLIYILSENGKVLAEPQKLDALTERVQQAALIDGWLLLSTSSDTVPIPLK